MILQKEELQNNFVLFHPVFEFRSNGKFKFVWKIQSVRVFWDQS